MARERCERDVMYVWSRFTLSSPYHETSPGGDNHTAADVCVCKRMGCNSPWVCPCLRVSEFAHVFVCSEGPLLNLKKEGGMWGGYTKQYPVGALHVHIRSPLLKLWSTKSPLLPHWIKPVIHGLKPHSPLPAFIYSQRDRWRDTCINVCLAVCCSGLNMVLRMEEFWFMLYVPFYIYPCVWC